MDRFPQVYHPEPAATLTRMVQGERMPHAMILLGPEGSGKLALALRYAQHILCTNRQPEGPCHECGQCKKVRKLIHPDLHFAFPTVGSKQISDNFLPEWREALRENAYLNVRQWVARISQENKLGNITAEECGKILHKLSLKKFEGTYKIQIIWRAEFLGEQGNRLLKLIEEPPPDTLFVLIAEDAELILNTILSRCQLVKVPAPDDETIARGLQELMQTDPETARQVAFLADGNFNEARTIVEAETGDLAQLFVDWLRICYGGKPTAMTGWTEDFAKLGRETQRAFVRYGLHFLREFLILKLTRNTRVRLAASELETARRMTKIIDFRRVERLTELLTETIYFVERNANPKPLFLNACITAHHILKG